MSFESIDLPLTEANWELPLDKKLPYKPSVMTKGTACSGKWCFNNSKEAQGISACNIVPSKHEKQWPSLENKALQKVSKLGDGSEVPLLCIFMSPSSHSSLSRCLKTKKTWKHMWTRKKPWQNCFSISISRDPIFLPLTSHFIRAGESISMDPISFHIWKTTHSGSFLHESPHRVRFRMPGTSCFLTGTSS